MAEDADGIVTPDKVMAVADLIEDELILTMPMIPRHEEGECPKTEYEQVGIVLPEVLEVKEVQESQTTYRPFAGLAETIDKQNT